MIGARELADRVRSTYCLGEYCHDEDLEAICAAENCDLLFDRNISRETGAYYAAGKISVARGISRRLRRWLVAHELCHHLRHKGGRFNAGEIEHAKKEHDAEVFAGWLMLGGAQWYGKLPPDLADEHDVPEDRVARWVAVCQGRATMSSRWPT